MLPNDWLMKREAEEMVKSRRQEAEAYRLAKLASQAEDQTHAYQRSLVRLGIALSRAGDYLQAHFRSSPQTQTDHILASSTGLAARPGDCP